MIITKLEQRPVLSTTMKRKKKRRDQIAYASNTWQRLDGFYIERDDKNEIKDKVIT